MLKLSKINLVICVRAAVLICFMCLACIYRLSLTTEISPRIEKAPNMVYVLIWTSDNTEPLSNMGKGVETFVKRKCLVPMCYVTSNRQLLGNITNFNAVLFHAKEIIKRNATVTSDMMPSKRSKRQRYVFVSMESAGYYPIPSKMYDGYFNLTWTFRLDSDIYFGYLAIRNKHGEIIGPSKDMHWLSHNLMIPINDTVKKKIANKKIAAAWFASNCKTPNKRENLITKIQSEMKNYGMSLDIYGNCGKKRCPLSSMQDCLKLIETDYYFYFAFENSFDEDYVTEKLLYALNHYAVPVVFGGANYTRFMPDGTYLHATNLGTQKLVQEMFELINDPNKYQEFFKWHNHYSYHDVGKGPDTDPICKFCEYINKIELDNKESVLENFEEWWNPRHEQWIRFYN